MVSRKRASPRIARRTALNHPRLLRIDLPIAESDDKAGFQAPSKSKTGAPGARLKATRKFKPQAPLVDRILKLVKKG